MSPGEGATNTSVPHTCCSACSANRAVASLQPVRSYHYLLALFDGPSSVAAKVLASFDIDREMVQQRITEIGTEGTTDALPQD